MLINIVAFLIAYFGMEFVAWFTHKYIMHGFLWVLHESHHSERHGIFELNDFFFVLFASIGITLILLGADTFNYLFWAGIGVAAYGFTYFILHDVFIHRRLKWFNNTEWKYFKAMVRAHKMHHKHLTKYNGESFGLLVFSKKYYSKQITN
jgi:beta-carotene 3-hydroxylase